MNIKSSTYLPFAFLSALRRGIPPADLWKEFRCMGIRLKPRLIFWLKLLREAKLIGHGKIPRPSRYIHRWLALSADAQTMHLLEAWLRAPKNRKERIARRSMLLRLKKGKPLIARDQRNLSGLQALGICDSEKLTAWGQLLLNKKGKMPSPLPKKAWYIKEDRLIIPFPVDWTLLWQLEAWMQPLAPGIYSLKRQALRRAVQLASPEELITLLEGGMQSPLPAEIKARILGQPNLNIFNGTIYEFSDPAELRQLRNSPVLRKYFNHLLSPRAAHVLAKDEIHVQKLLKRRGIALNSLWDEPPERAPKTRIKGRQSQKYFRNKPKVGLDTLLKWAIQVQEAVNVVYQVPNCQPEHRHISPLHFEERNGHRYLIAFCHQRRAQRMFRMDRMREG
jgi:hypothetical protein